MVAVSVDQTVSGCDSPAGREIHNGGTVKAKDRVRMHRDKRRAENFSRLDLWIDGRLLADLRTLATYRDLPLRALAQEAFGDVVGRWSGVLAIIKRQRGGPPVTGYGRPL